jgi:hypothetical protein
MKYAMKKQAGLTMISLFFVLAGIGFVVMLLLKIVPVYMSHSKVTHVLEALKNSTDIQTQSKSEITMSLSKRFSVESITHVDTDKDVIITKNGDYLKVEIKYQVEAPLMGNLSALMKFDDEIEVGKQ